MASHSDGRRRFVLIVLIPSVGRYDPVHSTWSVIQVCLLFTSIPVGLLFQYVCYSSADVTQTIPVYLIFVNWYDHVFVPVLSSLFVISWHDPVQSSLSDICQLIWPSPFQSVFYQFVCYSSMSVIRQLTWPSPLQSVCYSSLLFRYVGYSSVDMTQSPSLSVIAVRLLFIIWYYTIHSPFRTVCYSRMSVIPVHVHTNIWTLIVEFKFFG